MKTGLVLEGGAMRGMFTAGVLDVFMENGITFNGAIGVSAGATFGCNIKSKQIGRVLRYNKKYCHDWRYCSYRSLLLTGDLYGAKFCYHDIPYTLDPVDFKTFEDNPIEFYCVATDADTGKPLYHKCKDARDNDLKWIQGSASIPVFARPVKVDGHKLFDGGISDPIPVKAFEAMGYDYNVLILTQPASYIKKPQAHYETISKLLWRYPNINERIKHRYEAYNETLQYIKEKETRNEVFVIRPPENLHIGSICHDPDELERVYNLGRFEAVKRLRSLKVYMRSALD